MEKDNYKGRLELAVHRSRAQQITIMVLALSCVVLAFFALQSAWKVRTVIVPTEVHEEFWVTDRGVSKSYLREMSYYYLQLVMNVTPHNVDYSTNLFLKYVDPSLYPDLSTKLKVTAGRIKRDNVSTVYFPSTLDIDSKSMRVVATGHMSTFVGDFKKSDEVRRYIIEFTTKGTRLFVKTLCETNNEAKNCKSSSV
ncbi:MAG: type IV conjugative transfer system protein TraE [Candidatus Pacearchaeota archaeon]|nr:type IV conjugative transfer system protein TraE [Candidatus Pacearchaeota archaeon]